MSLITFIQFIAGALIIIGMWPIFEKAGYPGWMSLIPIWNLYITIKLSGRSGWMFLLYFVPLVNLAIHILVCVDLTEKFEKGTGFAIGLIFLPFIFYPILGFSDAKYSF